MASRKKGLGLRAIERNHFLGASSNAWGSAEFEETIVEIPFCSAFILRGDLARGGFELTREDEGSCRLLLSLARKNFEREEAGLVSDRAEQGRYYCKG